MTLNSFERALRAFTQRKSFRPFLIEFLTGERLEIRHREAVRLSDQLAVYVSPDRTYRLFDYSSVCQLLDNPAVR